MCIKDRRSISHLCKPFLSIFLWHIGHPVHFIQVHIRYTKLLCAFSCFFNDILSFYSQPESKLLFDRGVRERANSWYMILVILLTSILFGEYVDISTQSSSTRNSICLLYTSDAADDLTRVDLGGR